MFENLFLELKRQRVTYKKFAEELSIDPKSLSNKLNGKTEFRRNEMLKTSKLFHKPIDYLFGDSTDQQDAS